MARVFIKISVILSIFILNVQSFIFAEDTKHLKIVMLASTPNVKDHSFNEDLYNGLQKSKKDFADKGLDVEYRTMPNLDEYANTLEKLSNGDYDVIITVSSRIGEITRKAALAHEKIKYISIDNSFEPAEYPKNLAGVTFDQLEAGYLAGVAAGGLTSKYSSALHGLNPQKKVGIIQAMEIPTIIKYAQGFTAGVKNACPDCSVAVATVGSFNDPVKAQSIANSMYKDGIDIIFAVASKSSMGVIDAAKQQKKYVIRSDADQNYIAPDVIITSAIRQTDIVIERIVGEILNNSYEFGKDHFYGSKKGGVGLAPFHNFDSKIPKELKDSIEQAKKDLDSGKIKFN